MSVALSFAIIVIGAWTLSRVARAAGLPAILGMLVFGVLYGALSGPFLPPIAGEIDAMSGFLTTTALIVILLRAGLGIRMRGLRAIGGSAIRIAFIPCILETVFASGAFVVVFGFDPLTAIIGASILAAVSPAVVVPSMLELKERGIGTEKEVPTLVLAGASIDDVVAITIFTSALGLFTAGTGSPPSAGAGVARAVVNLPVSIVTGVAVGVIIGLLLSWFLSRHYQRIRATEKALLLVMVSLLIVELGTVAPVASLLAVMTVGFILLERAEHVAHEMASKLSKLWVPAEIVLFVLIGLAVDLPTAARAGLPGLGVIGVGLVGRSIGVLASVLPDRRLNAKERLFALIAYTPKATVQAALGAIPLAAGLPAGAEILAVSVLAIIVTAPLGLLLIRGLGPRLLGYDSAP